MPRGIPNRKVEMPVTPELQPLERFFDEIRVLMEARESEYRSAADRIHDILTSMSPKPRIGRPPKGAQ